MKSLTSFFVYKGTVSPRVLQEVLLNQTIKGGGIGINLLEMKAMTEMTLVQMTGQFHRLLVVALQDLISVPDSVIGLISRDLVVRLKTLPFDVEGENVYIACFQPPVKKDEMMIRNITGKIPRFFIASPLSIAVAHWIHYGVEISQRNAKIIERINREENAILDDIIDKVDESKRAHLMAVIEKRWDVFPRIDEKRETLVEFSEEEERKKGEIEPRWAEESDEEEDTDEIFSKYIVINRIGVRPRRHSGLFIKSSTDEEGVKPETEALEKEEPADVSAMQAEEIPASAPEEVSPPQPEEVSPPQPEEVSRARPDEVPPTQYIEVMERKKSQIVTEEARTTIQGYPIPIMGMLTMTEVLAKIEAAGGASDVIDAVHDYATQFFDFVMMYRYRKGRFELTMASSKGWGYNTDEFSTKYLYSANLPEPIVSLARPCNIIVEEDHPFGKVLAECGRGLPPSAILIPVSVQNRVVVVIYGDNAEQGVVLDDIKDLFHAAWMASNKLLSFIIEKKK